MKLNQNQKKLSAVITNIISPIYNDTDLLNTHITAIVLLADQIYSKKKEKPDPPMSPELKASVDRVYYAYPSKCPIGKSSTGKSFKDKKTIAKRLEIYSEEYLIKAIKIYIDGEKKANRWIKNFSTFLNNIPDIEDSSNGMFMSEKRIMWHVDPTNNTRTGTKEQYEADIKRYGKNSVKFIGDAV